MVSLRLSGLEFELSQKTETLITSLTNQICAKSKYLLTLEGKYAKMDLALQRDMLLQ